MKGGHFQGRRLSMCGPALCFKATHHHIAIHRVLLDCGGNTPAVGEWDDVYFVRDRYGAEIHASIRAETSINCLWPMLCLVGAFEMPIQSTPRTATSPRSLCRGFLSSRLGFRISLPSNPS